MNINAKGDYMRILFVSFFLLFSAGQMSAQQYTFSDLHTISIVANSYASDVNDSGVVVGTFSGPQAFKWTNGSMELIPLPSGHSGSSAFGINNNGTICGIAGTPFRLSGSTYSFLNLPINSFSSTSMGNINSSDNIVGYAEYPEVSATLWQGVEYHNLGILGGITGSYASTATFINDSGVIVGQSSTNSGEWHAFKYSDGTMQDLGTLPGNTMSAALGINNLNRIVGWSSWPDRPVFWDSVGIIHELALPQGALSGEAKAINDSGDIVGYYYPVGERVACIWKDGVPFDLNTLTTLPTGYQLVYATAINNAGQIVGNALIQGVFHAFMLTPLITQVTSPAALEVVLAGEPYEIRWDAVGITSLRIEVSIDSGLTYQTIATNIQASEKRYTWTVEDDILSAKCKIKITDTDDPTKSAKSGLFRIKPYILTRFKPNGDYEAFDPTIHGWLFPNSKTVMWPQSWWNQFDYENGFDPNTAQHYPDDWYGVPIRARSTNFPDWPLFVRAFGIDPCYKNLSIPTYSPAAVLYWKTKKLRDFIGSCFGFSVSSLLAFDFPTAFKAYFPELGNFTNVSELQPSDDTRRVINQLHIYQDGLASELYVDGQTRTTVRQTLEDLKAMFLSEIRNDHSLALINWGGGPGGHAVVPYALKRVSGSSVYQILVYDSDCPYGNCVGGADPIVLADSSSNTWSYPPKGFSGGANGYGLFLNAPANTFLNRPIMTLSPTIEDLKSPSVKRMNPVEQSYIQILNTSDASITITDFSRDSIGIKDTVMFNTMADGSPIIPMVGTSQPPIGYFLPSGIYSIRMNSLQDSLVILTVFDSLNIFNYWRSDATNFQSDQISYNNGLDVGNPDVQLKTMNLEAIVRVDSSERYFQVLNCTTLQNDSLRIMTPDNSKLKFVNFGTQKTYDLKITLAGGIESGLFSHSSIIVPANSSHYIVPNWGDLQNQPVKIYQDIGNIGTISDTIVVENQYTGIGEQLTSEIPCEFKLEQNYPNPFNPATIINFSVPKISLVTIKVYDVLGNEVATLVNEEKIQGVYSVTFDASHLSSGVYFYKINSGNYSEVKKMAFIK